MSDLPQAQTQLLPCPFCGGSAELEKDNGVIEEVRWTVGCNERTDDGVLCYGYQSFTTFATQREAIAAWNRRASVDAARKAGMEEAAKGRDARQAKAAAWCAAAFGVEHQSSIPQRGLRMLEEAIEAYQACGCPEDQAHKLVSYVFSRPVGDLSQELGGIGLTVLALAAAAKLNADDAEKKELDRVLAKPLEWFAARNKVKNDAGFEAQAYPAAIRSAAKAPHNTEEGNGQ